MSTIHDIRYINLINNLVLLRESKNITQVELCRALNKPQSFISKVENLDRRLDVIELSDWLKALDIEMIDFIRNLGI